MSWSSFVTWLRETVGPPLKAWHGPLDEWLDSLPADTGRYFAVALFIAAGVWALTLRRDYVYLGAPDRAWWRDLRLWAVLALVPYVCVYWWL